jgi:glucose/arabinose dehydrogenase
MRFTLWAVISGLAVSVGAGELAVDQPYLEAGGYVAGEAEFFHARVAMQGDAWEEFAADAPGAFSGARGSGYLRVLPDNGTNAGYPDNPAVEYRIRIDSPGLYNLWVRWTGNDGDSDSLFAGIPELADGPGGNVDWYQMHDNRTGSFDDDPWDVWGAFEANAPEPVRMPMSWNIPTAGVYTLRFVNREDGVALDAWILQKPSPLVTDPTNTTPIITVPDRALIQSGGTVGVAVLANDSGVSGVPVVEVVDAPLYGIATALADGRVRYDHGGGPVAEDRFLYRVITAGVTSAPASVVIEIATADRIPNSTVTMPTAPPPTTYAVADAFPGITFTTPTSMESPPGDTNRIYVTQRNGQVYVVSGINGPAPQKSLFMDISSRVDEFGFNELGMKGIAFHPGFVTNGIFFLTYCHWDGSNRRVRLSRFTTQGGNPVVGDSTSEVLLINQVNALDVHNINNIAFGPDGYLYLGIGDEGFTGPGPDGMNNSQRIDHNLWSAILRLDVDKQPGNLEPNPHPGVPLDGQGKAHYSIPADNPFLGATQFNGLAVNPANVRTEFHVVGLRNPWQFSFDPVGGDLWVADVGNNLREEVTVFPPGGNGGWVFFEGTANGPRNDRVPPPGFTYDRPVWEYNHGNGEFQGRSITGGLVYRGAAYPGLVGRYVFGDYVSGNIWALERGPGVTNVVRITGEGGVVQFGLHPATGEILLLDLNDGRIRKLVAQGGAAAFPETLSATGFFADLTDLAPNPGVVAYTPNLAFWSDYAIKQRWFVITNTTDTIGYDREGNWSFPTGMMWVKHFDLEMDRGNAATRERVETRVLVRTPEGAYGVSYRWNSNGTEAVLAPDAGVTFSLAITNQGVPVEQTWRIPSRAECLVCHTPAAGHALSFNTRQLNAPGAINGVDGNFLARLHEAGYLHGAVDDPATVGRHLRPDETEFSVEARSRSYLDVNCGYCHRGAESTVPGAWDGRAFVRLEDTDMVRGAASANGGNTNNLLLVPLDLTHSIIWNRVAESNGFSRMPPLATFETDPAGVALLAEWIDGELGSWQTYAMWRAEEFGTTNSPAGEPGLDADGDTRSNEEEFLTRTDPNDPLDYWTGDLVWTDGAVEVGYDLHGRSVVIETTEDVVGGMWRRWESAENAGLPLASGTVARFTIPATNRETFFRFQIRQP